MGAKKSKQLCYERSRREDEDDDFFFLDANDEIELHPLISKITLN
jgi:hypothetical protein